ncbi:MAG: nitroreductase family protein [Alphaproteobacteria bacterium]|nr:nitroreductase family protein [Alphaproteobacteria bacterium]
MDRKQEKSAQSGWDVASEAIRLSIKPLSPETMVAGPIIPAPSGLGRLLCNRRSERSFSDAPIPQDKLERVLVDCAGGVKYVPFNLDENNGVLYRTIPQGGGINSVGVSLILLSPTEKLNVGLYKFCSFTNSLHSVDQQFVRENIISAMMGHKDIAIKNASAILIITVDISAKQHKYKDFANKLVLIEVGCALQNALLSICDLGLAGYAVGGFDNEKMAQIFGLSGSTETPCLTIVFGVPKEKAEIE